MSDGVACNDGLEWLRRQDRAQMIYLDPPYGHGSFGAIELAWVNELLVTAVERSSGIVYFHCDPELLFQIEHPVKPRGMIAWANGWVSGFKSKSTRFWPRQYQLIVGYAVEDWRWQRVEKPRKIPALRKGATEMVIVSDWWDDITPVDQASFSREKVGWKTQKPLALLERLIEGSTNEGDLVLDPTCGSGTTLLAAKNLGRRYKGCDVDPDAVRIALGRVA